jgi:hypothetical protein
MQKPAINVNPYFNSAHIWECLDEEMREAFVHVIRLLFPDLFGDDEMPTGLTLDSDLCRRICRLLVNNPHTSSIILSALSRQADPELLERIAEHPRTNAITLLRLARHESPEVRAAVADNAHVSYEVIMLLANDPHPDVRYRLAENHNLSEEILHILSQDDNPYVACRAQQTMQRLHPEPVLMLLTYPSYDYSLRQAG